MIYIILITQKKNITAARAGMTWKVNKLVRSKTGLYTTIIER